MLKVNTKDFLSVTDFTKDEILNIFKFTEMLKKNLYNKKKQNLLSGKTLAMIFEKSSTRTRVSFEAGMLQLGGHALFLNKNDIQLGRGEPISDTAKILSRYVDCIMIRSLSHDTVVELAKNATVPVINGLSDSFHPCQSLADFFTIYEFKKKFRGVKLSYIGDGNNVANSLILCSAMLGIDISVASPEKYMPDTKIVEKAYKLASNSGAKINITPNINEAIKDSNFIYTDVWISMGEDSIASDKKKDLAGYKITKELLYNCADDCLIMHCLPAHRGEEIDADVIDSDRSIVFDQAENRLHVQKAILCSLI